MNSKLPFDFDEIKKEIKETIQLDKNDSELTISIKILKENIDKEKMLNGIIANPEEMKINLARFMGKNKPIDCEIINYPEEKLTQLKFNKKQEFKKVYKTLYDLFYGDYLKTMFEALFQAFGHLAPGNADMNNPFGPIMPSLDENEENNDINDD